MAAFLFVVPPLTGHVNPTVALGRELERRGHRVAWAGYRAQIGSLLPEGAEILPMGGEIPDEILEAAAAKAQGLRGMAALEFLWRDFLVPLALAMVPGVEAAVEKFGPDCLVVDQQAFAGGIVARRQGLPWATSATTSAELVDPFAALPKVGEWVRDQLRSMQVAAGVDPERAAEGDLRFSEQLVLAYTTEELVGPALGLPAGSGPVAMVGPSLATPDDAAARHGDGAFPWEWLESRQPKILVSLGTVNGPVGARFYSAVVEAVAGTAVRAVLVAPPELVGEVPENVLVRSFVPQLGVLERVDAVVCHGGHNTVCESLAQGLPLVVAPIRDDQPIIAEQVVRSGAGIRVRFGRVNAGELRDAIGAVLGDPAFVAGAGRVQRSFRAAGGAPGAADRLETLLG